MRRINAAVELADPDHPDSACAREHKRRFRGMLDGLVAEAVGKAHDRLIPAVAVLAGGAIVTAVHGSADAARDAALVAGAVSG